jgi:hypothetical protein
MPRRDCSLPAPHVVGDGLWRGGVAQMEDAQRGISRNVRRSRAVVRSAVPKKDGATPPRELRYAAPLRVS